ncbi:hypothetical protein [Acinetobacter radioresistens]|uniref:hypothetical protein n=1 Tax=Acinetobacter radioresistens TaxID=40216 RepID=UPI0022461897|nr:hypothetical protein [Acinetobacter radioresistens]MCX0340135.1 hypothetical protein [Acinetobacter radioresistens]
MGFFSSISSAISSACSSIGSSARQSEAEDNAEYKKYAAEIKNFKIDPKIAPSASSQKSDFQLNNIQDELDDIDSLDDVKKYFQDN